MTDSELLIRMIDEFLAELGTSGLVDARKARDQLMDLRLVLMHAIAEIVPETIETVGDVL